MSCLQNEISAAAGVLKEDRNYFLKREETNSGRTFIELGKVLSGELMEAKRKMYEDTKQAVETYIICLQIRLKETSKLGTNIAFCTIVVSGCCVRCSSNYRAQEVRWGIRRLFKQLL